MLGCSQTTHIAKIIFSRIGDESFFKLSKPCIMSRIRLVQTISAWADISSNRSFLFPWHFIHLRNVYNIFDRYYSTLEWEQLIFAQSYVIKALRVVNQPRLCFKRIKKVISINTVHYKIKKIKYMENNFLFASSISYNQKKYRNKKYLFYHFLFDFFLWLNSLAPKPKCKKIYYMFSTEVGF